MTTETLEKPVQLQIEIPSLESRRIFRFFDGNVVRGIDPLQTWRALIVHPKFSMEKHPEMACPKADSETPPDNEAMQIMLDAIREVFKVEQFSEVDGDVVGLTDAETLKLWFGLAFYLAELKKNISLPRT